MSKSTVLIRFVFAASFLLAVSHATAAEKLSDILRKSNWEGIIGTWVDSNTGNTTTFSWKIKDRVIEMADKEATKQTVSLIGVNGKSGEVFHMGADSDGTSAIGRWKFEDQDAELGVLFTTGDGQEGALGVRYHREDADHISVSLMLPDGGSVPIANWVRSKSEN